MFSSFVIKGGHVFKAIHSNLILWNLSSLEMSVLGSRNHYCINSKLKEVQNKNEACQELLDSEIDTCVPAHRTDELVGKMKSLKDGKNRLWDMEDLIGRGKNMRGNQGGDQWCCWWPIVSTVGQLPWLT